MKTTALFSMLAILLSIGCSAPKPVDYVREQEEITQQWQLRAREAMAASNKAREKADLEEKKERDQWMRDNYSIGSGGTGAGSEDWSKITSFLQAFKLEGLQRCNKRLKWYYDNKKDMSKWEEVTKPFEKIKSDLSDSEARLATISRSISHIQGQEARRRAMLDKVEQAQAEVIQIRNAIQPFEDQMKEIRQEKENALKIRKNEIERLRQSGQDILAFSDGDVRIELTDLGVVTK